MRRIIAEGLDAETLDTRARARLHAGVKGIGRDVPLPPEPGRFWRARTEQMRPDTDPIGPEERACADLARRLAPWTLGMVLVSQVGVAVAVAGAGRAGAAGVFLHWTRTRTFEGAPEIRLGDPVLWLGIVVIVVALAASPATWFARRHLERLVPRGGRANDTRMRAAEEHLGEAATEEQLWTHLLEREIAGKGARPETIIRWVRSVRTPPDPARRAWMVALREHLKDAEALAQTTIVRDGRGGIAAVAFAGGTYEAAELTTLSRRAADGVRDLLATLPPT